MATIEQLSAALVKADAAGNTADAKVFADALRALKAQGGDPTAALNEKLARPFGANPAPMPEQNNRASVLPGAVGQFQNTSNAAQAGFNQGLTLGFGDELYAGATAPFRALPGLVNGEGYDIGKAYESGLQMQREGDRQAKALNPVAAGAGEITGAILNPLGRAFGTGKAATTMGNVGRGLAEGATMGAAYGFGSSDGDLGDRARGAATGLGTGALLGAAVPFLAKKGGDVVEGIMQNRATSQAVKGAPSAAEAFAESSAMFKAVDDAGVTVKTDKFSQMVQSLVTGAKKDRINPALDPKATAAYQEIIGALDDVQKNGGALTISDLHTLRQIAQKSAQSSEGRDAMFSDRIVDALDDFIAAPGSVALPTNRLGKQGAGGNELLKAISTWSRARKVSLLENAVEKAQNYQSGVESGLRAQFKTLLNGKRTGRLFSKAERKAMQDVINGGPVVVALRTLGMFKGFASAGVGGGLGSMFGPIGSAMGTALGGAAGLGARKITEASAVKAANRAAQVVATPNVPSITFNNPLRALPGGPFSLPAIDMLNQRQAIPQR